jgi:OmpA-OmpF porin, OOP family
MSSSCQKCGAELAEGNAFCRKCGARRESSAEPAATQQFCTKCGAALAADAKFCAKCGAILGIPSAPAATTSGGVASGISGASTGATDTVVPQSVATRTAAKPASKGMPKIALVAGGAVALVLVVAAVAGMVRATHRAQEKARQMEAAQNFAQSLSTLTSSGKAAKQNGNTPSAADINKAVSGLANALTQNAEKQGGTNSLSAIQGVAGTASGSNSGDASNSDATPGSAAAMTAASAAADAALTPPSLPTAASIVPQAATGNQAHDWALKYERTVGGPEADLVVRTGDINNLGFGWPKGFDPFSGQSTPQHSYPWNAPTNEPSGTDRIMLGTGVMWVHMVVRHVKVQPDRVVVDSIIKTVGGDGYSGTMRDCFDITGAVPHSEWGPAPSLQSVPISDLVVPPAVAAQCTRERQLTMPAPIVLPVGTFQLEIHNVVFQIFVDDFQPQVFHSHFQVSLNGTRIPSFEYAINSLNQTGPIGKLLTLKLLPEYWPLLKSGTVELLVDDPTTHVPDGYAIDFVRILVNPHRFKYQVSLNATVKDADTGRPISGATVTAALDAATTDGQGKCEFKGLPAGLVVATANAPGYDESSVPVDLPAGQSGTADIQLHRHQESAAALEQSIAQTGSATIYGIHFDTGSSKLRADSMPALNAVLGLINGRSGSNWIIAGHTDNQGSDALNIPLSKSRAASVIAWLTAHGIAANRLEPQGFGSTRPVADNATASGRALNRRVEVSLGK